MPQVRKDKDIQQICFLTTLIFSSSFGIAHHNPVSSLPCESCRLFWFPLRQQEALAPSTWKHVFTKSFIDSGYPKHPMQSRSDLLFKAGPKYELKIWLHAWLTASMDSEFPQVGFRIESRFTDNGENSAQYCSEREKMNLGCQLNSLCSYSTCLLEY